MMDDRTLLLFVLLIFQRFQIIRRRNERFRRRRMIQFALLQRIRRRRQLLSTMQLNVADMLHTRRRGIARRPWVLPRPAISWFEFNWNTEFLATYWQEHFRMSKNTFHELVALVAPQIWRRDTRFRPAVSAMKRVAIALWRLANGASYRTIATNFGVGKSTCVQIPKHFCEAICRLAPEYIKFPVSMRETATAIAAFQDESDFPQAVGAIDVGTHIEIVAPSGNPADYFDREKRFSITLQAVVGGNGMFMDTAIGYPGSMHDARVLRSSELLRRAERREILDEPCKVINGHRVRPLILGDGAYPILPWLMKPFPSAHRLTVPQPRYNGVLCSARSRVEHAFGVLKARWRILLKRLDNQFDNVPRTVLACCVLHNFCQLAGEENEDEEVLQRVLQLERNARLARRHDLAVAGAAGQVNMGQEIRRAIQDSLQAINE